MTSSLKKPQNGADRMLSRMVSWTPDDVLHLKTGLFFFFYLRLKNVGTVVESLSLKSFPGGTSALYSMSSLEVLEKAR